MSRLRKSSCFGNPHDDDGLPQACRPYPSGSLAPISALICLVLALSGCKDQPAQDPAGPPPQPIASTQDATAQPGTLAGDISDPVRIRLIQLAGEVDVENRYLFTVFIEAHVSPAAAEALKCSGVLIGPRLVLTAGHCVCPRQNAVSIPRAAAFIDRSACAATAILTAMTYLPPERGEGERAIHARYEGVIHPHPELKILLEEHGRVISSHADLAVIILNTPLPAGLRPVKLAETEVELHAPLITVGHGNDGSGVALHGKRRFNRTRVASPPGGQERIFLDPPKNNLFTNDSGGPCLRETGQGFELVGVSNRGLSQESTCTSTYFHRAWLHDELLEAAKAE